MCTYRDARRTQQFVADDVAPSALRSPGRPARVGHRHQGDGFMQFRVNGWLTASRRETPKP